MLTATDRAGGPLAPVGDGALGADLVLGVAEGGGRLAPLAVLLADGLLHSLDVGALFTAHPASESGTDRGNCFWGTGKVSKISGFG